MNTESEYSVVLLDKSTCEITQRPAESIKEAKAELKHLLSDEFAKAAGSTHESMGTFKAEVRNVAGECILDRFY